MFFNAEVGYHHFYKISMLQKTRDQKCFDTSAYRLLKLTKWLTLKIMDLYSSDHLNLLQGYMFFIYTTSMIPPTVACLYVQISSHTNSFLYSYTIFIF